jgi:hypothetical protein
MMFMIPGVYQSEGAAGKKLDPDFAPDAEAVSAMMKYNEELAKAGALISLDGLHPSSQGARVKFKGRKPLVTDGPFTESKEVIGGYWMIDVKSKAEAIEWAKRVPASEADMIEVRQVFEMSEFPEDVQKAADSPVMREQIKKYEKK